MQDSLMKDPRKMGIWEAAKTSWLKRKGLLDYYDKQQGRQQAMQAVGKVAAPYELSEDEKFNSYDDVRSITQSGLPDVIPTDADGNPLIGADGTQMFDAEAQATNAMTLDADSLMSMKGSGLLGGETTPMEFYGKLLGTQGYEAIGSTGLMNIYNNENATTRAKDSLLAQQQAATLMHERTIAGKPVKSGIFKDYDQRLKARQALRKEATPQLAPSRESLRKFNQATDILRKRGGFNSMTGADDTIFIKAFASMILPGEAVMEGDIGAIVNQAGLPGWLRAMAEKAQGGQLGSDERAKIYDAMVTLAQRANTENIDIRGLFDADIKAGGFDPTGMFRAPLVFEPFKEQQVAPPPSGGVAR